MSSKIYYDVEGRKERIEKRIKELSNWLGDHGASLEWGMKWQERKRLENELEELKELVNQQNFI